ncbi:MAG: hypothetical protein FIB01_08040 [Gemmatimonadetes bacterium]|nr:hypothetical protein [Gemmatimonadota bacterium]
MNLRHLLSTIVAVLLLPGAAGAQRPDFLPLRDSIAQLTDVVQLQRLERSLEMPGVARTLAPVIRRGLLALRSWELSGDRADADRARETFQVAVQRFPREPWSHYGLALALAHGPEVRLPVLGGALPQVTLGQTVAEIFKRDPRSRARRALREALGIDPGFGPAAVLLARLALDDARDQELVREARGALLQARQAGDRSTATAQTLAAVATALGNYAAAARAAAGAEGEAAGVLRSRGIALLLQGSEAPGYAAYRRGIDLLTDDAAGPYYGDLTVLLTPQEAAEWRVASTVDAQRAWLARFWDRRAAEAGVTPAARVGEHFRRLALARASYVRQARRGSESAGGLLGETAVGEHVFDDRGVVLIRHGVPRQIVSSRQRGLLPNESWIYDLPGIGPQLFHFVALRGAQDYTLVGDLLDALDARAPLTAVERQRAVMALIEDRANYEPGYRAAMGRLRSLLGIAYADGSPAVPLDGTEVRSILERVDADYRRGARAALRTDTYAHAYEGALAFEQDLFTFRTPFGRTDLTAAFAIPAEELEPLVGSGGTEYALRLSVILTDTLQDVVTRADTARTLRVDGPLGRGDFLRTFVTLPVIPSEHTVYRVVVEDVVGGRGSVRAGGATMRDYSGTSLQVSDVVLARPDSVGDWRRGDVGLDLLLPRRFGPDRPVTIFYELYNLPADTPYGTEITVEPTDRGGLFDRGKGVIGLGPDRIRLRFDDVARSDREGVAQEVRRLASALGKGSYSLTITVTNRRTGESATTRTSFNVSG